MGHRVAACLPEPWELSPKPSKEPIPTNAAKETPMLGLEPAPTRSTSLPSSSPWDLGLPGGMPEQDGLQWGCSKHQPPAKD